MSNKQPEALRLADCLSAQATWVPSGPAGVMHRSSDELRRQHALIEQMREFIEQALFARLIDIRRRDAILAKMEAQQ